MVPLFLPGLNIPCIDQMRPTDLQPCVSPLGPRAVLFSVCRQIGTFFWDAWKNFGGSGQHNPARWAQFSKGHTVLDYLYTLFSKHHLIFKLINPHIGAAGVEGDAPSGLQQGTRQISSGRKKRRVEDPAFDALVLHSSEMAAAAKKHADSSELSSLSATLKNLKDAGADPEIIHSVKERLRLALSSGMAARVPAALLFDNEAGGASGDARARGGGGPTQDSEVDQRGGGGGDAGDGGRADGDEMDL